MKKIPIWKNLVLIGSAIVVIVIATFAWFNYGPRGSNKELGVRVGRATYIQVSAGGGGLWSDDLNVAISLERKFEEISGDGTNLFAPVYEDVEASPNSNVYEKKLTGFEAVDTDCYFEQDLYFRSDTEQDIFLSSESFVKNWEPREGNSINGAVRVALFEVNPDKTETLRYIWAPNSKVQYSPETDSFTTDGAVESYYYYQTSTIFEDASLLEVSTDNVAVISTAETDQNGCGYSDEYRFMWTNGQNFPENMPPAFSFLNEDVGDDGLYYKTIKVRVWLEGYDRECVSKLSAEKFIVKLEFKSEEGDTDYE